MSKKKNSMGLRKFHWFKLRNSETKTQYTNTRKSQEVFNITNEYNQKIYNHLLHFRHNSPDIQEQKLHYKLHLLNLINNESGICDGDDFLFKVDRTTEDRVDASLRDETVKNLQIINKVYYELPFEILCSTIQLIDRFISRVKVRPRYMFCTAAACYQIILKQYNSSLVHSKLMKDLPSLSSSGGSTEDFIRMEDIIRIKLVNQLHTVTIFDFIEAIMNYFLINHDYSLAIIKLIEPIMETAILNYSSAHQKPSILSLACIMVYNIWYPHQPICSPWTLIHLSTILKMDWSVIFNCANLIVDKHINRFNQINAGRHSHSGLSRRRSESLTKSVKWILDTIVEE